MDTRYNKAGDCIEVHIKDEYWVISHINLINYEQSVYRCDLAIKDKETRMTVDIDKSPFIISDKKSVRRNVANELGKLVDAGFFDKYVHDLKFLCECMEKLLHISKGETANA